MSTELNRGTGQPALDKMTLRGAEILLKRVYPEFESWISIFNENIPSYAEFLADRLDEVFFSRESYEILSDYYVDLGIPNSEVYVSWYDELSNALEKMGMGNSAYYGPMYNGEAYHHVLFELAPWDNEFYEELKSTNDYWWFLVCLFSKIGSVTIDGLGATHVAEILLKIEDEKIGGYSSNWLKPLDIWIKKFQLMEEYKNISLKSISDFNLSNLDLSNIDFVDITNIPEYELDKYIGYDGKYYEPFELFKAITASGGFAQALEKQDLEPRVANVNSILRKNKKRKNE
jgi:hypothetical protein